MTRRELVCAAIEHRPTPRVPYNIRPDGEMQTRLRQRLGWTRRARKRWGDSISTTGWTTTSR